MLATCDTHKILLQSLSLIITDEGKACIQNGQPPDYLIFSTLLLSLSLKLKYRGSL